MRLVVDLNRCQGYAQCAFLAPEVFTMHGEETLVYDPAAEDEHREKVARAVAACPVRAITAEGLDDTPRTATANATPFAGSRPESSDAG
ncbi:ferredoxin [Streptomyces sp. NPDC056524]|uniref:ferredoxin n=1 Tax=Streptomyces sp. NPDC056524 TaxID=3345851 RepID=UPI003685627B